jgi:hypothetical protein
MRANRLASVVTIAISLCVAFVVRPKGAIAHIKCPVKTFWGSTEDLCPHFHPPYSGDFLESESRLQPYYGAISYDPGNRFGWSAGRRQEESAKQAAVESCGGSESCRSSVIIIRNGFGALAINGEGAWFIGQGETLDNARSRAIVACNEIAQMEFQFARKPFVPCTIRAAIHAKDGRVL